MLRIKICGLTNLNDARLAESLGAWALGFVFHAASPRAVDAAAVRTIIGQLSPHTLKVGVFVEGHPQQLNQIAADCQLDRLQLHGNQHYDMLKMLHRPAWRVFRPRSQAELVKAQQAPEPLVMLDAWDATLHGGSGKTINWSWGKQLAANHRVILAGGLQPENIAQAIEQADPFAIDAASGLESSLRKKDPHKMQAFFQNAHAASRPQ